MNENFQINEALGVVLSCVSPENYLLNSKILRDFESPFGFKLNGFDFTNPKLGYSNIYNSGDIDNPNLILGKRQDLDPKNSMNFQKHLKI